MKRSPADVYYETLAKWRETAAPVLLDLHAAASRPQATKGNEALAAVILTHPVMRRISLALATTPATPQPAPFGAPQ